MFEFLGRSSPGGVRWAWAQRDLDMAAAPVARHELTDLLPAADDQGWMLVYLGVECFVDLHGLRVLVDVTALLRTRGGELVVVRPPRSLQIMVGMTGFGTGLSVVPTARHATRRVRAGGGTPGAVPHRVATGEWRR